MADTRYQILYRYVNPSTKKVITNKTEEQYEQSFEFYHNSHQIEIGTDEEKSKLMAKRDQMIIDGNENSNPKFDMLFRYTGTKRKCKTIWVPAQTGYVVKNTTGLKVSSIGDYSGDYVYVGGNTPETATIVAKKNKLDFADKEAFCTNMNNATGIEYISVLVGRSSYSATSMDFDATYYLPEDVQKMLDQFTIFKVKPSKYSSPESFLNTDDSVNVTEYTDNATWGYRVIYGTTYTQNVRIKPYTGYVVTDKAKNDYAQSIDVVKLTYSSEAEAMASGANQLILSFDDIETMEIPGHFEEVLETPYAMCDTYEKINLSPWFSYCMCSSLDSAIEKARKLVESIGIENVQIIKVVPTDQFVRIQ